MRELKVVVTGGSGYLGTRLVSRLLRSGHEVLNIDCKAGITRMQEGYSEALGDINRMDLGELLAGTDAVIHLAANQDVRDPERSRCDTYGTTEKVVEAMVSNSVRWMIFVSSSSVYGPSEGVSFEGSPCNPVSEYAVAKRDSERLVEDRIPEWTSIRFANLSGRNVSRGVVYDFFRKLQKSDVLEILGNGEQVREYLHVDDAVSAIIHILDNSLTGVYNVGNSDPISVMDVAGAMMELMGMENKRIVTQDSEVGWAGDVPSIVIDSGKIRSTGWAPEYSSLESVADAVRTLMISSQFE